MRAPESTLPEYLEQAGRHVVYRFVDAEGVTLYVGVSSAWSARFATHRSKSPWFASAVDVVTEHFAERKAALRREYEVIRDLCPLHNRRAGSAGEEPEPGERRRIFVRCSAERYEWLYARAQAEGQPVGLYVSRLLDLFWELDQSRATARSRSYMTKRRT